MRQMFIESVNRLYVPRHYGTQILATQTLHYGQILKKLNEFNSKLKVQEKIVNILKNVKLRWFNIHCGGSCNCNNPLVN